MVGLDAGGKTTILYKLKYALPLLLAAAAAAAAAADNSAILPLCRATAAVRRLGDVVTTVPTIGFNVETVEYKNIAVSHSEPAIPRIPTAPCTPPANPPHLRMLPVHLLGRRGEGQDPPAVAALLR